MPKPFEIHPAGAREGDLDWVLRSVIEHWGAETVVARGMVYHPAALPGFIAWRVEERIGLVTYHLEADGCEIVTLDSQRPGIGVGTALIEAVRHVAQEAACRRLRVITTNDNLEALRFYQKRGFYLVAVHPRAMEASRRLKPEIPLIGQHGIPLRDEIELEMPLG